MHSEGNSLMWQAQPPSKVSHAILRQALLCPEKEKDDIFSLDDKRPVRGSDPLLGASGQTTINERRFRKRRLSENSVFDIAPGSSHHSKFKTTVCSEKLLFDSAADLIHDDIHPEIESTSHLPGDNTEYTSHLLSQLSSSPLLPTITSSQVSSVLSALEPNTISQLPPSGSLATITRTKSVDHTNNSIAETHLEPDFIKQTNSTSITIIQDIQPAESVTEVIQSAESVDEVIQSAESVTEVLQPAESVTEVLQPAESVDQDKVKRKRTTCLTTKAIIRYYTENKVKDIIWYQCSCCPFLSLSRSSIVQHCFISHDGNSLNNWKSSSNLNVYKCLACDNIFSTTHSLKVHYTYDHNATNEELEDLIKFTIETNKLTKTTSSFIQIKPVILIASYEKDVHQVQDTMAVNESTVHQVPGPGDTQSVEINQNSTTLLPLFFAGEQQANLSNQPLSVVTTSPSRCSAIQVAASVLQPSPLPTSVPTTVTSTAVEMPVQSIDMQTNKFPSPASPKFKDPALIKFRDLKLEKGGGKKCGLGGCALRFGVVSNLEYHKKCHHRSKWRCPECNVTYTSWNTLSSHLWRDHGIDIELYSCDHCSYKTNSLTRLLNLHRRIHSEERPFLCDVCGKGFKTTKQLRNHKSWHKLKEKSKGELSEKVVSCLTCGRGFKCARLMRLHVQVVHKRLKPYLCYVCGHSAASRSSLRSHLSMHTGLRPYSCDECDYTTRDHNNLRRHKMRHSGLKRYKCPLCTYSSIQASTYKTHILKKHPGEQDGLLYRCNICPFNTVKKENLLTHSARHEVMKSQDGYVA